MWVLINNVPINIFNDLNVSTIIKFDSEWVEANKFYYKDHQRFRVQSMVFDLATKKKWLEIEKMDKDFSNVVRSDGSTYYSPKFIQTHENSIMWDGNEFFNIKNGYVFCVSDNRHFVLSDLYETEDAAQEAYNKMLSTINKIVARLQRITI